MTTTRSAAVAGMFYPGGTNELRITVNKLLLQGKQTSIAPRAIIAPHAGYIYSGTVAASAYNSLKNYNNKIHKIVLLGPAHRVAVRQIAAPSQDYFETPLGKYKLAVNDIKVLTNNDSVGYNDNAHKDEHCLEVHIPFLQILHPESELIPLVVGHCAENIDLKAFTEEFYWKLCGAHLQEILDTIIYVKHETDTWFELTNLIIPGENDNPKEIEQMCQWIMDNIGPDVPLHFTAFHPDYKLQDKNNTPLKSLLNARNIAIDHGLNYVYTGNVHHKPTASTYCTKCGQVVIGRDWYILTSWELTDDGHCKFCGEKCAGVFSGPPGTWGNKRLPVKLKRK
jgi:hypothetical protein